MTKSIDVFFKYVDKIKIKYILIKRKHYWKKRIRSNLNRDIKLSKSQFKEIKDYFKPYLKVNKVFCDFYYQKTGIFSKKFIPHDLYYNIIDPYYNNWDEAKFLDNKCYYEMLFPNIKQPLTIAKKINNIWYDEKGNIIDEYKLNLILKSNNEFFLKSCVKLYD